tara:strand:+ start:5653 stop:7512 length:1860 start_codon:yes stop_codon:yes gene_type:complete
MATQEVTKYSVYDPRVVQTKPKYAVEKGALSLTNVSFNAQTANQTTQQFNVIVPSENVFIDRAVDWISSGVIQVNLTTTGAVTNATAGAVGACILLQPSDVAPAAFPSHQCVSQMTATINDATVTVNTQDVLNQVLRLQDLAAHRTQRTCPTMLDTYSFYPSSGLTNSSVVLSPAVPYANSPLNGYGFRFSPDGEPNGAWGQWYFCQADGSLGTSTTAINYINSSGLPVATSSAASGTATQPVYIRWQSTEKLLLPPFIFGDSFELSTGFFGVQNFQVQMNMAPTPSRAFRFASSVIGKTISTAGATATITTIGIPQWVTSGLTSQYAPYSFQPALSVQFLTPALDVPLPPKSIVPYMEFPRYITTGVVSTTASIGSTLGQSSGIAKSQVSGTALASNTITLPNIPDLLMIYVKPATPDATLFTTAPYTSGPTTWNSTIADFVLPIQSISLNFDNFSGLLSNATQYQLYKMSVANGLNMSFAEWSGETRELSANATASPYVGTAGGPLVLRPGRDFALQAGQAPGLVGNFTLQFSVNVGNQFPQSLIGGMNLYVVPISSGFFETIKGSSRIIKGVLTEQDILGAAPAAPSADHIERPVGAGVGKSARQLAQMAMSSYRR